MKTKTKKIAFLGSTAACAAAVAVIAGCGGGSGSGASFDSTLPVVSLDAATKIGAVNPLLFGVNHRWLARGSGSTDEQGNTYPLFLSQMKDAGITMVRYPGGTLANAFQWSRAIGPLAQRTQQVSGLPIASMAGPQDSLFGPDEFGKMLDATGATGNLMLNFATANAADTANFVAYMTSPQGAPLVNGVDWAAKRAANGHAAPYKIAYAEMGNEVDPVHFNFNVPGLGFITQTYWMEGDAVTFTNPACASNKVECLYAFGGSTRFTNQAAVTLSDWRPAAGVSSGAANQMLYAKYAPVTAGSATVSVDGVAWTASANLAAESAAATVYQITESTGAIQFGDGVHGAIPASGAKITVSYVSGPHDGFVDYAKAIKAVNPAIKVCSSIYNDNFIKIMGSTHAYDCLSQHPYTESGDVSKLTNAADYFAQSMVATEGSAAEVQATQAVIKQYAGANASKVELLLSEYGHVGTMPSYAPHFQRSLGDGIQQALLARQWMLNGIVAADRHALVDYTYGAAPADMALISAGDRAVIQGPGPNSILSPTALAIKLFAQNLGTDLVKSSVTSNPSKTLSNGKVLNALQTVGMTDAAGNAYFIVINQDPTLDVKSYVVPTGMERGSIATVTTLNSTNILDDNTPTNPDQVKLKQSTVQMGYSPFEWTFPAHSVTAIKMSSAKK